MNEKTLTKIALICSLIGILLLLLIAERQDVSASSINKISNQSINQEIKIKGTISTLKETPAVTITQVKDTTGSITVIMFRKENITLQKGDLVEVQGIVKEFKGKLEIEAKRVLAF